MGDREAEERRETPQPNDGLTGPARESKLRSRLLSGGLFLALIAVWAVPGLTGAPAAVAASGSATFVNVSATSSFVFDPGSFSVLAGQPVHLVVTQLANFEHRFVLSSVVNSTIPASDTDAQVAAYFTAHPPLVNMSLGATPGAKFYANFTAPALGTYEFVCTVAGHFQSGMHGTMTSATSLPPPSGSAGLTPLELGLIVAAIVIALAAGVGVVLIRRRPKAPTPPAA
jgi:uncharacterized cupredoxin-like copper-binding protein